jgi:hypothetical protein
MNRKRSYQRWTKAFAALFVGSMMINPASCVPKDFAYDVATATQQTLAATLTSLVANSVTDVLLGDFTSNSNSNANDNSSTGG